MDKKRFFEIVDSMNLDELKVLYNFFVLYKHYPELLHIDISDGEYLVRIVENLVDKLQMVNI